MKRIWNRFLHLKINHKIIFIIYFIMGPVLLLTSIFLYVRNANNVEAKMYNLYTNSLENLHENMMSLQSDVMDLSTYIVVNEDILHILNASSASKLHDYPLVWEQWTPVGFVKDMVSIKNYVKTMVVYCNNRIRPFYISRDGSVHNMNLDELYETQLYKQTLEEKGEYLWTRMNKGEGSIFLKNTSDKIVVTKAIFNLSKSKTIGYLAIGLDANYFVNICEDFLQQSNEGILMYSEIEELLRVGEIPDEVVAYVETIEFNQEMPQAFRYGDSYLFRSQDEDSKNQVFYVVPKENWLSQRMGAVILSVSFIFIFLIFLYPLSILISNVIAKPLKLLIKGMSNFKHGNFEVQVKIVANDEIGEVTEYFNKMVRDIKNLVDKNYVMEIREKQSELDVLQANINPHFLYNALDSLYWQALENNSEKLAEDIFSLSQLFRIVLSQGQSEIPVEREKELVYRYLQIQKMRFGKKMDFTIDMDEEILKYYIPKLILQPFVENAIVHGLECINQRGMIWINGHLQDNYIVFEVKDNGVGMTEEQVKNIFEVEDSKDYSSQRIGKYAIHNVRERLNIKYQCDFELKIDSKVGSGTSIFIRIPIK